MEDFGFWPRAQSESDAGCLEAHPSREEGCAEEQLAVGSPLLYPWWWAMFTGANSMI